MQYCEDIITGIDGSEATFVRYVLDNSEEIDPKRQRPSVLVIPGGGYAMTSDREAEPIAMQFLAAGCNAFVLRYSVAPSVFPTALLEAAEAVQRIRAHADDWHCDPSKIAVIGFSAGGHLAANLATTAGDDTMRAHGYDPDAVRPNALMLGYPVITSARSRIVAASTVCLATTAIIRWRWTRCPSNGISTRRRRPYSYGIPSPTIAYRSRTR